MPIKKHANCTNCDRRLTTEWSCLSSDELRWLDEQKIDYVQAAGDTIYNQGDDCSGVYCIKFGLIGLRRMDAAGNSILIRLAYPGETIGYRAFLRRSKHNLSAEVLVPSEYCHIGRSNLRTLLAKNPVLGMRFLDHSLQDAEESEDRILGGSVWRAKTRLLHILLVLYERYGTAVDNKGGFLELPLTRMDIAELVGTTPETLSRLIKKIESENLIRFDGRKIKFLDLDEVCNAVPAIG